MVKVYASLVIKGVITLDQVPQKLKLAVETLVKHLTNDDEI